MKKVTVFIIYFAFLLISNSAFSQTCKCSVAIDAIISTVENSYAGFYDKTNAKKNPYKQLKQKITAASKQETGFLKCYYLTKEYLDFFNDRHLSIRLSSKIVADTIFMQYLFKRLPPNFSYDLVLGLINSQKGKYPITGYWRNTKTKQKIAVVNSGAFYDGIVLNSDRLYWYPGQVRFQIPVKTPGLIYYINNDKLLTKTTYTVYGDSVINIFKKGYLMKMANSDDTAFYADYFNLNSKVECRELKEGVMYFGIPSFDISVKHKIDSLADYYSKELHTARALIIDLRNNSGGYSASFEKLMPIILKGNKPNAWGYKIRASEENILNYSYFLTDKNFDDSFKVKLSTMINKMKDSAGSFVSFPPDTPFAGLRKDIKINYGQKIYLLINENSVSAAEFFALTATGNPNVVICGTNSGGAIDYTDIGFPRMFHCGRLHMLCPMSRSDRVDLYKLDNVGITPKIRLQSRENEWVDFILNNIIK